MSDQSIKIYVLRLEQDKYYVGKTINVCKRYQLHKNGLGSEWTKLYKPIKIVKVYHDLSPFDEDKITKEYMSRYQRWFICIN